MAIGMTRRRIEFLRQREYLACLLRGSGDVSLPIELHPVVVEPEYILLPLLPLLGRWFRSLLGTRGIWQRDRAKSDQHCVHQYIHDCRPRRVLLSAAHTCTSDQAGV